MESGANAVFQWGKIHGIRSFVMADPARRRAVVLLTNANRGLRLLVPLVGAVLPGPHPSLRWVCDGVTE